MSFDDCVCPCPQQVRLAGIWMLTRLPPLPPPFAHHDMAPFGCCICASPWFICSQLILKSMRSREHQQQLQYNPHYGYQQPRIAQDGPRNGGAAGYGVAAGVGAGYAHVLNPSGTTSLTSAQRRVPEEAPQHNGEGRQPNSRTTSGSGSEGSDGDGTSGGSPPGDERSPAGQGSDEPQEILTAM